MGTINEYMTFPAGATIGTQFKAPTGSITDTMIATPASGSAIDADKLEHRQQHTYTDERATTIATQRRVLHVARGTGTLLNLHVGLMVAMVGGATATIGLRKNGTEITSADLTLDNADAAYALVSDTGFSNTSVAAADVFEVEVKTAAAGGGTLGTGFFCVLSIDEETS